MLSSLVNGRDADGYSTEGIDVVPERKPKPSYKKEEDFHAGNQIEYSLARKQSGDSESKVQQSTRRLHCFKIQQRLHRVSECKRLRSVRQDLHTLQNLRSWQRNHRKSSKRIGKRTRKDKVLARLLRNSLAVHDRRGR